jgi:uncharacterized protein
MTVLFITAAFLAIYNNVAHMPVWENVWRRSYVVVNLAVAASMLLLARPMLTATQLGLGEDSWLPGLAWGAVTMVAGAVVLFVSQRVPVVAETFEDRRYAELTDADAVKHALVRVPLGTALLEEVAFRGVLFALWEAAFSTWVAVIGTSVIFGIWHVGPILRGLRANGVQPGTPESKLGLWRGVGLTALAGFGFGLLRVWSGGILAPFLLHWAVNALGVLTAVQRQRRLATEEVVTAET